MRHDTNFAKSSHIIRQRFDISLDDVPFMHAPKVMHFNSFTRNPNLVPSLFPLRASLEERPGPGWSRVSQILGDNNWDLWGIGKANVAFEFKTIQGVWIKQDRRTTMKQSIYWHVFFIKYVTTVIVGDEVVNKAWLDVWS
jgi:hypothetical protein